MVQFFWPTLYNTNKITIYHKYYAAAAAISDTRLDIQDVYVLTS